MNAFSASDAALAGVSLIRRSWRVVLGWAGFNLLSLVMLVVLTVVLSVATSAVSGGARAPVEIVAGSVVFFGSLLIQVVIAAAVFRLALRPEEPAFLHLRLGADELRLMAVWLLTWTGVGVVVWAAAMLGHGLGFGRGPTLLLALAAGAYPGLRSLLAAPISFVERRIDYPRSWRLTRRRVGALLGMRVLSLCLIALLMTGVAVVLALIAAGAAGLEGLASLVGGAEALQQHPGVYLLEFAVEIILIPVLWVLWLVPLASAYQALAARAGETP